MPHEKNSCIKTLGKRKRDEYEEIFYIDNINKKNDETNSTAVEIDTVKKYMLSECIDG